jgi:UTP-glucose-1-phosphate uridylyltransferase
MAIAGAPALVVMAAGAGSRFGGPKQTAAVGPNGEWLLEYAVYDARRAGFGRVLLIIREELRPQFSELIDRFTRQGIDVRVAYQRIEDIPGGVQPASRTKPWGTGHAVLTARHDVESPFAIMNADDFYGADAYRQGAEAARAAGERGISTVVGMRLDRTLSEHGPVKRGWAQTNGDRVTRLEEVMGIEKKGARYQAAGKHASVPFNGQELVSMNFWVFPPAIFSQLGAKFDAFLATHAADPSSEFLLPEAINELIDEGQVDLRAVDAPGPWFGLTYQDDRPAVEAGLVDLTRQGVYPSPLWK